MAKLIYDKTNGQIIAAIPNEQSLESFAYGYDEEIKEKLSSIFCNEKIKLENYKVIDEQVVHRTQQEIQELQQHGKILTEEERQLNKLKPSPEEVKKAENTIEILSLLQEVGI